MKSANSC